MSGGVVSMGVAYKTGEVWDIMRSIAIGTIIILLLLAFANVVCAETAPVEEWSKTFGGTDWDWARSVQQTTDGGYILAGDTESYGAGEHDFWLVKADSNGNKEWDKTFGGTDDDWAYSVQQTTDGGYILAGTTRSYGAGWQNFWLVKTDSDGNKEWDKTFGGTGRDQARSVQQTTDGGYILAGEAGPYEAGGGDFGLVKTDSDGNKEWNMTFGRTGWDQASSVQQTTDGGYTLAGMTRSYGAGREDFWLVKAKIPEQEARLAIPKARFVIESANKIGADTTEAQNLLDQAETALSNSKYQSAIRYATQAEASAMKSKTKQLETYAVPILIALLVITIKAAANARKRVRREEEERLQKQVSEEQEMR